MIRTCLQKGNLKRETESLLMAAQNKNYVDQTQKNSE